MTENNNIVQIEELPLIEEQINDEVELTSKLDQYNEIQEF